MSEGCSGFHQSIAQDLFFSPDAEARKRPLFLKRNRLVLGVRLFHEP